MIKAKEIMTTDVVSVTKETPITEAVRLLVENDVTGLPVVGEDMTLVGILTEKDVLRLLQADELEKEATVEDFMTTPAIYFSEDESLSNISDCLMTYDFRRVPITSGTKLVGIISRCDILMYMLQAKILKSPLCKA
jgi:CBS domain-containing protein